MPLTASVSSDADATEIAQPLPSNFDVGDAIAVEIRVHGQAIAAQRIVAVRMHVGRLELAEVPRMAVVIDDHVAIEVFEVHRLSRARLRVCSSAATSRSISSNVL